MLDKIKEKIKKETSSLHHKLKSKKLSFKDGSYLIEVPHYTERCGWKEFGASSEQEYEYWWQRACGMVSLLMIMDGLDPENKRDFQIFDEVQKGIEKGAYEKRNDIGWIHNGLIKLAKERGIKGRVFKTDLNGIIKALSEKKIVIASTPGPFDRFLKEGKERKTGGGHLVLIKGFQWKNSKCTGIYVNDPYDKEKKKELIEPKLFEEIFSGGAIFFWK